jgi:hypothetical protein
MLSLPNLTPARLPHDITRPARVAQRLAARYGRADATRKALALAARASGRQMLAMMSPTPATDMTRAAVRLLLWQNVCAHLRTMEDVS